MNTVLRISDCGLRRIADFSIRQSAIRNPSVNPNSAIRNPQSF